MSDVIELSYRRRPSSLRYMWRGVMPVRRQPDLNPRIVATWCDHHADSRDLASFLAITGLPAGPDLPLLYPHVFGFRLAMSVLTHPAFPVPIWGVLQTRNHLVQHEPIPVESAMDLECRVLAGRPTAKGAEFDLRTTVHVGSSLAHGVRPARGRVDAAQCRLLAVLWLDRRLQRHPPLGCVRPPTRVSARAVSPAAGAGRVPQPYSGRARAPYAAATRCLAQGTGAAFVEPERPCIVGRLQRHEG